MYIRPARMIRPGSARPECRCADSRGASLALRVDARAGAGYDGRVELVEIDSHFLSYTGLPMPPPSRAAALCTAVAAFSLTAGCASGPRTSPPQSPSPGDASENAAAAAPDELGVLVMAHGGRAEWNGHVRASVSELGGRIPLAVAFGMAAPHTLQSALDELRTRGVGTIAVVRLFLSGDSFLHQTEFLFGLRPDPPARAMMGHRMVAGSDLPLLETEARILMDPAGMAGSDQVNGIVLARAGGSSPTRRQRACF